MLLFLLTLHLLASFSKATPEIVRYHVLKENASTIIIGDGISSEEIGALNQMTDPKVPLLITKKIETSLSKTISGKNSGIVATSRINSPVDIMKLTNLVRIIPTRLLLVVFTSSYLDGENFANLHQIILVNENKKGNENFLSHKTICIGKNPSVIKDIFYPGLGLLLDNKVRYTIFLWVKMKELTLHYKILNHCL